MAYSLGLTLYSLAARRETGEPNPPPLPRPTGRLIWLHAPDADLTRAMAEIGRRMVQDDGYGVVLTTLQIPPKVPPGVVCVPPPAETAPSVAAFLDHWQPDCALFSGGELRPLALHDLGERHIPVAMVNAVQPSLPRGRDGWWPGLIRSLLTEFPAIHAIDATSARAFRKAGATSAATTITGRLEEGSAALPCNEAERAALGLLTAARPIWLAADIPEAEEQAIIAAHRTALRLAHRLLLVIVPRDPARVSALTALAEAEGWTVARRSADEEPDNETEIYIADAPSEYGLWYRLAPITFLGGSLSGTGCLRNPMEPASLGSAIIHGPRPGVWGQGFGRLGAARAARSVASANDLAEAVSDLLSPDRAARLASAAWAVASDGVEATDQAQALIRHLLGDE